MPVCPNRLGIGRHRVVRKVACNYRTQPSPLFGDAVAASIAQLRFHLLKGRSHAVASRVAPEQEGSAPRAPTDEREPQEVERLRFALPGSLPPLDRIATELQQPGLLPMQFERELLEPFSHRVPESARIDLVFEAHDQIVGIPHHDHVATGFTLAPSPRPQVEDVVQVDVGQQR